MNLLLDTSVWINHFRLRDEKIANVITSHRIFIHPFIIGELACGSFKNRTEMLSLLQQLPMVVSASHEEVLNFIDEHALHGKGVGYVDLHILMSSMLTDCGLWTLDKNLSELQKKFEIPSFN